MIKLDCIGHVQKRLGKALYEFQSSSTKLEDGKPMKGRNGRLTKTAIKKLKKYYGKAVRNNVKKGVTTTEERDRAVHQMQTERKAGLFHCLKHPEKKDTNTAQIILGTNTTKVSHAKTSHTILTRCSRGTSTRSTQG